MGLSIEQTDSILPDIKSKKDNLDNTFENNVKKHEIM